ncbi:uncharacterized protein LOC130765209 isoform X1 [Actinidia eriantha]|uniref:uncharacterized protein LOC130765209 isoform X1 n=1 Tax=Actinidia eriantha TaxID=165200 RepID=UPI00258A3A9A|nr:uncharacterized protein LOC130765209 isoform X1 [Actinidia eriantha]
MEDLASIQEEEEEEEQDVDQVSVEGNASFSSILEEIDESSHMTQAHDDETFKESKLGDIGSIYRKTEDPSITRFSIFMMRKFLFAMRLNHSEVEQGRLFVPVEITLDYFPPLLRKTAIGS